MHSDVENGSVHFRVLQRWARAVLTRRGMLMGWAIPHVLGLTTVYIICCMWVNVGVCGVLMGGVIGYCLFYGRGIRCGVWAGVR